MAPGLSGTMLARNKTVYHYIYHYIYPYQDRSTSAILSEFTASESQKSVYLLQS